MAGIRDIVEVLGAVIDLVVTEIDLDELFSGGDPKNAGLWPVPPLSAAKVQEEQWPEVETRPHGRDWPVFIGHRYGLGEDV